VPVRYEFCKFCSRIYDAEAASSCPHCAPPQVLAVALPQGPATQSRPDQTLPRSRYGTLGRILAWSVPVILLAVALGVVVRPPSASNVVAIAPKPNDTFKECANCPEMVVVPAGRFTMGSERSWKGAGPQHTVTFARPFAVARFAVTFDDWDACVADGGCNDRPSDEGWGRGRRPVINVRWDDAKAYAAWLSRQAGAAYRLPSEAEYEYAALAGATTTYPWGDEIGEGNANCDGCGSQWDKKQTAPVGSFAPNAFGLYDVAGNVWQWIADCYHDNYKDAPNDGAAWTSGNCNYRVVRGGAWYSSRYDLKPSARSLSGSANWSSGLGFRLARTLTR
jgi:formylglycine-generating enzyme required for sulfatase activity